MAEVIENEDGDQEKDISETGDRQILHDLTLLDEGGVGLDDIDLEEQGSNDDKWEEPNASSSLAAIHTGSRPTDDELFANMVPEGEMIIEVGEILPTSEAAGQLLPEIDEPYKAPEGTGRGSAPEQSGPEEGSPQKQNAGLQQTPASLVPPAAPAETLEPVVPETDREPEPELEVEVTAAEGGDDTAIALDIDPGLSDADGTEILSIKIADIPAGSSLSYVDDSEATQSIVIDGTTASLSTEQLNGLTITPPDNLDGAFDLNVSATSTEADGNVIEMTSGALTVNVTAVASNVVVETRNTFGSEDQVISLDITTASDDDITSVVISGVPKGAALSKGIDNEDGTWTLTGDQLGGLTISPAPNSSDEFQLSVAVTTIDGADSSTVSGTFDVNVTGDADTPLLKLFAASGDDNSAIALQINTGLLDFDGSTLGTTASSGKEDTAIALDIDVTELDTDGSETVNITITDVPTDSVLSAGTDNEDGTWTLEIGDLEGLTIMPSDDSNTDFQLGVSVTTTESNTGETSTSTATLDVSVISIAYAPELTVFLGEGAEVSSSLTPVSYWKLDETGENDTLVDSVGDNDGSSIKNLRDMDGGEGGDEAVLVKAAGFKGGGGRDQEYIEVDDSPDLKPDSGTLTLWFDADDVDGSFALASSDAQGSTTEGGFNLRIEDGQLTLEIEDENGVHRIEGGSVDDGDWNQVSVSWGEEGMHLYLNGEEVASDESFTGGLSGNDNPWTFGATAGSEGGEDGMSEFFDGHLDDIAIYDTQISSDQASDLYDSGVQDVIDIGGDVDFVQFPLDVMASLTDIDGSESLSIMIDGLPDGGALSSGTDNGDGSLSVDIDGLEGLTVSVPVGSDNFAMTVSAKATDEGGDSRTATEIVPVDIEGDGFIADVSGTASDDTLSGTADADVINSGAGNDDIDAGAGDNINIVGDGDVTVASGDGDGIIDGGTKNDTTDSGAGDDLFIFSAGDGSDYFNGGDGWSDTVQLGGVDSGPSVDSGWALQVEGGVGDTETENGIEFDEEVAGSITLSDGSELTFDGVEKLEW